MNVEVLTRSTGSMDTAATFPIAIAGVSTCLPPRTETAAETAEKISRTTDWVLTRAGVAERHVAEGSVVELGAAAARPLVERFGPPDLLIGAGATPHQVLPDNAAFYAGELGLAGIATFSVHASCLSFLTAMRVAAGLLAGGAIRRILVVSAEISTRSRNFAEPESAALLGDGAAAAMFEAPSKGSSAGLLAWRSETHPEAISFTEVRGGGLRKHPLDPETTDADNTFCMNGPAVYRIAMPLLQKIVTETLAEARLGLDDIDLVVPHQASGLAIHYASKMFGVPDEKIIKGTSKNLPS